MSSDEIVFEGKIFEIVHSKQDDGRVFEVARRAPGVRLIILDKLNKKVLLTKEFRKELNDWDYRLPGGKVFDSLGEYEVYRTSGNDIMDAAVTQAKNEALQEAGVHVDDLVFYKKSVLGATVEWDLYIFEVSNWYKSNDGQQLEAGEEIEADTWVSFEEVRRMVLDGHMQEERIALILLQWIERQEK